MGEAGGRDDGSLAEGSAIVADSRAAREKILDRVDDTREGPSAHLHVDAALPAPHRERVRPFRERYVRSQAEPRLGGVVFAVDPRQPRELLSQTAECVLMLACAEHGHPWAELD